MLVKEILEEVKQWRQNAVPVHKQLDKDWIQRYRALVTYDSYWWLTWAGPFTDEEQQEWDQLFRTPVDEAAREQLNILLMQSRERELVAAIAEQREPQLRYPAIEIEEV